MISMSVVKHSIRPPFQLCVSSLSCLCISVEYFDPKYKTTKFTNWTNISSGLGDFTVSDFFHLVHLD